MGRTILRVVQVVQLGDVHRAAVVARHLAVICHQVSGAGVSPRPTWPPALLAVEAVHVGIQAVGRHGAGTGACARVYLCNRKTPPFI